MATKDKKAIHYVTSSAFKQEENRIFCAECSLQSGVKVGDAYDFVFRSENIKEMLEVDLCVMVQAEAADAYSRIRVPCIVEHAGLIFDEYEDQSYPGGLTKPMWDTLGDRFIEETNSSGRRAIARAVVAYCDGKSIRTFTGETAGTIADSPRGSRKFYWDTVFMPDDPAGKPTGKTYAEITDDQSLGLEYKVRELSQSAKAMLAFLEFLGDTNADLWGP